MGEGVSCGESWGVVMGMLEKVTVDGWLDGSFLPLTFKYNTSLHML